MKMMGSGVCGTGKGDGGGGGGHDINTTAISSPVTADHDDLIPNHKESNHYSHSPSHNHPITALGTTTRKEKTIRYLFKKPKSFLTNEQRQKQAQEHKHENWMELFMDLFYVAFFLKLGVILHTCGTGSDIMTYVASVFIGVYMCKFDFDQYMNKFTSEDLVHKIFFAIYSLGLAVMVLDVNESSKYGANDDNYESKSNYTRYLAASVSEDLPLHCPEVYSYLSGFTSGWLVTRLSILTLYVIIAFYVKPQGVYLLQSKAPILITSCVIMTSNYFFSSTEQYVHTYIIMVATLVEFFGWAGWEVLGYGSWLIRTKGPTALIPTNIYHYAARTGTFVMLVLGEAVLALLTPTLLSNASVYAFTLLGTTMIFILALLYFDAQPQGCAAHALGISRLQGMIWISLHPLLSFLLFGVGVSLKLMYEDIIDKHIHPSNKLSLGVYLGLSLFTLAFIRATHKEKFSRNHILTLSLRCIIAMLHIFIGVISSQVKSSLFRDETSLVIHIILILIPTLVDAWKYRHLDNLPALDANPQPATRIPSGETRPVRASSTFSQLAYSPSLRNMPAPLRPRRSSSVNDMYNKQPSNSATIAIQSLKGSKPSAVVKQIVRRSSLPSGSDQPETPTLFRDISHQSLPREHKPVTRRKSSGSIELSTPQPLHRSNNSLRNLYERSRVIIAPTLSIITDRSERSLGENEQEIGSIPQPQQPRNDEEHGRTRIFEYNENDELVEVTDDQEYENDENHMYDEEYIDVVYEDEGDNYDVNDDEIHVFETSPAPTDVASHITWM